MGMGIIAAYGIKATSTRSNTMACVIPEIGDLPPFLTFAAVRAIAPVAGIPPKKPEQIFPKPCAMSSVLELCLSLIIPSETTHESKDSIPAKSAMVNALGSTAIIFSPVIWGIVKAGSLEDTV